MGTATSFQPDNSSSDLRCHRSVHQPLEAATQRLVLLAPRGEGYGFDVRSLQELMAARRLTTGKLDEVTARLRLLAPSPHWRNTWLFAAGRILASPQSHEHDALMDLVRHVDQGVADRLSSISPTGPYLAWEMLDDGMAGSRPRRLVQLVEYAMSAIDYPAPQPIVGLVPLMMRLATISLELREGIRDALRESLGGDLSSRTNATTIQHHIEVQSTHGTDPDVRILAQVRRVPGGSLTPDPPGDWNAFTQALEDFGRDLPDDAARTLVMEAATALDAARSRPLENQDLAHVEAAVLQPAVAEVLEVALDPIARTEPEVMRHVIEAARSTADRRLVSHLLDW